MALMAHLAHFCLGRHPPKPTRKTASKTSRPRDQLRLRNLETNPPTEARCSN
jgi:hypothetical protein